MNKDYKIEGNIVFPDEHMLTWGPFYYHSEEKAKNRMESVLNDIVSWCNLQDPSLQIEPEKLIKTRSGDQICFYIKAWKDETHLEKCSGIVSVEPIYFED